MVNKSIFVDKMTISKVYVFNIIDFIPCIDSSTFVSLKIKCLILKSIIMANSINWFEIPAKNFERAQTFYGEVLGGEIHEMDMDQVKVGFLPGWNQQSGEIGGAIMTGPGYEPSDKGSIVYLNGGDDLNGPLGKVEAAGGKVLMPKTGIGENGFIAHFMDCEGNKVAFHSMA